MAAGTLSVTNNSKAVVGVGTTFTAFKAGDFLTLVVGQVPYTVAIASIESATALTLVLPFDGPTATGLAWDGVKRDTMSLATMGVTVQAQKALRLMIADENNWRAIFGDAGEITVTLPNGQVMQGMSWGYLSQLMKEVDPVEMRNLQQQAAASKAAAQGFRNEAEGFKNDTNTIKAQTNQIKTDTQALKNQTNQIKTDTGVIRDQANTAKTDAQAARDAARGYRNEAEQFKNEVDPDQFAKVSNNLSDLTDKSAARQTLNAIGVGDYGINGNAPSGSWNEVNGSTYLATVSGSPIEGASAAGLHVKFAENYAVQFAARQSRFFWRTKEDGVLQNWCEAVKPGDYGLGIEYQYEPPNTQARFFSQPIGTPTWSPANGAGFQSAYAPTRVAQVMVGALPALYYRWNSSGNAQVSAATAPWSRVQDAGTSDARVKDIKGNLNVEAALDNINRLEFKLFRYTFDEPERSTRRGIIAQQAATVDREYVHDHEVPGMMTLDLNPLVADCLAAIKALRARDEANKAEIAELKAAVAALTKA
nr:MAG TPA: endosialidase chaperone [Bacteriophage sp.]